MVGYEIKNVLCQLLEKLKSKELAVDREYWIEIVQQVMDTHPFGGGGVLNIESEVVILSLYGLLGVHGDKWGAKLSTQDDKLIESSNAEEIVDAIVVEIRKEFNRPEQVAELLFNELAKIRR